MTSQWLHKAHSCCKRSPTSLLTTSSAPCEWQFGVYHTHQYGFHMHHTALQRSVSEAQSSIKVGEASSTPDPKIASCSSSKVDGAQSLIKAASVKLNGRSKIAHKVSQRLKLNAWSKIVSCSFRQLIISLLMHLVCIEKLKSARVLITGALYAAEIMLQSTCCHTTIAYLYRSV